MNLHSKFERDEQYYMKTYINIFIHYLKEDEIIKDNVILFGKGKCCVTSNKINAHDYCLVYEIVNIYRIVY